MTGRTETFIYNKENLPVGGSPGDVLLKVAPPNFYSGWSDLTYVFENFDVVFDEGEY